MRRSPSLSRQKATMVFCWSRCVFKTEQWSTFQTERQREGQSGRGAEQSRQKWTISNRNQPKSGRWVGCTALGGFDLCAAPLHPAPFHALNFILIPASEISMETCECYPCMPCHRKRFPHGYKNFSKRSDLRFSYVTRVFSFYTTLVEKIKR